MARTVELLHTAIPSADIVDCIMQYFWDPKHIVHDVFKNACVFGYYEICKDCRPDPEKANAGLISACKEGYYDIALLMLEFGATELDEPLGVAASWGHSSIVELLINNGAGAYSDAITGCTDEQTLRILLKYTNCVPDQALFYACSKGDQQVIDLLIEHGANDWEWGLCGACAGGHEQLIKLMISKGAHEWDNAFRYAAKEGQVSAMRMIYQRGSVSAGCVNSGITNAIYMGKTRAAIMLMAVRDTGIWPS